MYVADSEADIYELYAEERGETNPVDWVIRLCQDRALVKDSEDESRLIREQVLATPVLFTKEISVRGRAARVTCDKRRRNQPRQNRKATVAVRATTLTLRPPWRSDRKLSEVCVNVILVSEVNPPVDDVPVEWLLITTLPIASVEDVKTVIQNYTVRWMIEMCQADYPSSRRWVFTRRIGYHRRDGVARVGRVVPATARQSRRSRAMSDTRRCIAPPRA